MARGYSGDALRIALAKDKEYQKLVKARKQRLTKTFKLSASEKRKYLLSMNADWEILRKCKQLEHLKLTKEDKQLVKLIKAQLEHEWRKSLLQALAILIKKYKKK